MKLGPTMQSHDLLQLEELLSHCKLAGVHDLGKWASEVRDVREMQEDDEHLQDVLEEQRIQGRRAHAHHVCDPSIRSDDNEGAGPP